MPTFNFMSWNMKNLSENSVVRQYRDFETNTLHQNLTAYTNMVKTNLVDVFAIIEVTIGTGQKAVDQIQSALGINFFSQTTRDRTFITRKGEFNAIIVRNPFRDGTQIDNANTTEQLLPQTSTANNKINFLNRVPVLFTIPLQGNHATIQVISWHAPQPKDVDPDGELHALATILAEMISGTAQRNTTPVKLDASQPFILCGDFNFDTDPSVVTAWQNHLFVKNIPFFEDLSALFNGEKTTLVAKDPNTYAKNSFVPITFEDLLANAYDTIIHNTKTIRSTGSFGVNNHLQSYVADDKITFVYHPSGSANSTQLQIKNANKISDHCAVLATFQF